MDQDGDHDLLTAFGTDDKLVWYENDGNQAFEEYIINSFVPGARSAFAADLDGDTDIDVLSGSYTDGRIAWY